MIFTDNFHGMYACPGSPWVLKGCRKSLENPSKITFGASHKSDMSSWLMLTSSQHYRTA
jgi:hypothetical protein